MYLPKPDHRDGTAKKSQWVIPVSGEVESFRLAIDEGWFKDGLGWSLHLRDDHAAYLGTAAQDPGPAKALFLALFEIAPICHGFPADHRRSSREKPPTAVRSAWLDRKYLRPAVIRKIGKGQRCSL